MTTTVPPFRVGAVSREELLRVADTLPSGLHLLSELERVIDDAGASLDDVVGILRPDPGLTTRVIRIGNSPVFTRGVPAASIEEAVGRLGLVEVRRITAATVMTGLALAPLDWYGTTPADMRENSLFVALVAEELAEPAELDPKALYTAGLLRSIGKVLLERVAKRMRLAPIDPQTAASNVLSRERAAFGLTNSHAAVEVLGSWRFGDEIVLPIRNHYIEDPTADCHPTAILLNLACSEVCSHGFGLPGECDCWLPTAESSDRLNLSPSQVAEAVGRAQQKFEALRAILG